MKDLEVLLENTPGALALFGETLGQHGISLEGGGVFQTGSTAIAHFLVAEPERARAVLEPVGIRVVGIHDVLVLKLRQDVPGQLGQFCRALAQAGVNILVQYSDHANQLIVVVDDFATGTQVVAAWQQQWW
ncbi:amino acid-binding ACT domain-containing protein [Hymenobacter chitinivorans]|uniref:ACT domain-containing protein n=1 Tax=Hymenobacter chitinivorans DSM 11115 TaxID=1121954 RepID=A0A2M9AQA7_9BACT|nr:amino acid-binding ACT domain-containing protein [Hymenobacter chitinivorans]PJJ47879.1 hypothetical protein CLV45_4569 [Hymenobacter chitinivorans DSM 11115]